MSDDQVNLNEDSTETLVQMAMAIQTKIAEWNLTLEEIKRELKDRAIQPQTLTFGNISARFENNYRFDPKLAERNLTPAQLKRISKLTPNATLAKEHLTEQEMNLVRRNYGMKLTLALMDENESS